jgi:hypothetical protein
MTFDYVAMENRGCLIWDRMPAGVQEMILEAVGLGAVKQKLVGRWWFFDDHIYAPAPSGIYRIIGWRAPGDQPEPPKVSTNAIHRASSAANLANASAEKRRREVGEVLQ